MIRRDSEWPKKSGHPNDTEMKIHIGYNPGKSSISELYPVTPGLPEFRIAVEAICSWPLDELSKFALARHGYGNTDGGCGVTYPSDLDDYDRQVERISIREGFVRVYTGWGFVESREDLGGAECEIPETTYLEILRQILAHNGRHADAEDVARLQEHKRISHQE